MYHIAELTEFTLNVFLKMGYKTDDSILAADVLMKSEIRGISTHGLMRLPEYVKQWKKGRLNVSATLNIIHESPSTALVDGDNGLGLLVAQRAMQIAIEKAKQAGTGWVAVKNSNHFGIAGYHAMLALKHDMIGISMTNANPLVAPTFSKQGLLGTNPIAFAIPAYKEPPFVADFATSAISRGKLDIMEYQNENVPHLLVQDEKGMTTDDPSILQKGGAILPLGGDRIHSSHKGYCMSAIVEILSAVLPGASFSAVLNPTVDFISPTNYSRKDNNKGIGHFFGAMRIDAFQPAEDFKKYMDYWIQIFRKAAPINIHEKVLIPGDPEREAETINMKKGIRLSKHVYQLLQAMANELKIPLEKINS